MDNAVTDPLKGGLFVAVAAIGFGHVLFTLRYSNNAHQREYKDGSKVIRWILRLRFAHECAHMSFTSATKPHSAANGRMTHAAKPMIAPNPAPMKPANFLARSLCSVQIRKMQTASQNNVAICYLLDN